MLDDIRIYDRELSGADVNTLYGSGNGDFVTVRTGNQASIKKAGTVILTGYAPELPICSVQLQITKSSNCIQGTL